MRDGTPKRPRRRRGSRADDPYTNFYASYYGVEEAAGRPTRHRASATRTGSALAAGLGALLHRKATVVLALCVAVVAVLAVGLMVSATRTGSDPEHSPSLVDTTGSPTTQGSVLAGGASSHPARSSSATATATSGPAAGSRATGDVPVDAPPVVVSTTSQAAPPPGGSVHSQSSQPAPPPATQHSTSPSPTRTSSSAPPPSSSPTPSPSPSCVLEMLHLGHCLPHP